MVQIKKKRTILIIIYIFTFCAENDIWEVMGGQKGLPLIMYAPKGRGGGSKSSLHFHCVLHAKGKKKGGGGPDSM